MLASVVLRFSHEPLGDAELPPRARRIQPPLARASIASGTTSACAENTSWRRGRRFGWRNYLRVRGEYIPRASERPERGELPPRARRILAKDTASRPNAGTTSACAENTGKTPCPCRRVRNYLRVRGEYGLRSIPPVTPPELPPRARRIQRNRRFIFSDPGTTSACAENTARPCSGIY